LHHLPNSWLFEHKHDRKDRWRAVLVE
jgi:hypothetical protein